MDERSVAGFGISGKQALFSPGSAAFTRGKILTLSMWLHFKTI